MSNESNEIVTYTANDEKVSLTPEIVRNVLTGNPNITDREVMLFIELCRVQHLNPFVNDAYLVKYGDNPATMIVGKDVFTKRAQKNPKFKGLKAGITVIGSDGKLHRREGSMILNGEYVVGGWCGVFVDGYENPMYDEVSFMEYAAYNKRGELNKQWASKPGTMIRKVAIVHALREAFPDDFAGLYDEAEMGNLEPDPPQVETEEQVVQDYQDDVVEQVLADDFCPDYEEYIESF